VHVFEELAKRVKSLLAHTDSGILNFSRHQNSVRIRATGPIFELETELDLAFNLGELAGVDDDVIEDLFVHELVELRSLGGEQ